MSEISADREKCKCRYQSETNFSRLTDTTALKDRVPRGFFRHLNSINNWGNGCANFQEPFYIPAKDNYFDNLNEERNMKKTMTKRRKTNNQE